MNALILIKKLFFQKQTNTQQMELLFKTTGRGGNRGSALQSDEIRITKTTVSINESVIDLHGIQYGWYGALGLEAGELCFIANKNKVAGMPMITNANVSNGERTGYMINIPKYHHRRSIEIVGTYRIQKTIREGDYIIFTLSKI